MNKNLKKDINTISRDLTMENKKYVIAVANALLFSQNQSAYKKQKRTATSITAPSKPTNILRR